MPHTRAILAYKRNIALIIELGIYSFRIKMIIVKKLVDFNLGLWESNKFDI